MSHGWRRGGVATSPAVAQDRRRATLPPGPTGLTRSGSNEAEAALLGRTFAPRLVGRLEQRRSDAGEQHGPELACSLEAVGDGPDDASESGSACDPLDVQPTPRLHLTRALPSSTDQRVRADRSQKGTGKRRNTARKARNDRRGGRTCCDDRPSCATSCPRDRGARRRRSRCYSCTCGASHEHRTAARSSGSGDAAGRRHEAPAGTDDHRRREQDLGTRRP